MRPCSDRIAPLIPTDGAPLVSVVIPAFNVGAYLSATLDSVLSQSLARLEVIVVDDASTDGTAACALSAAGRDGRVRLVARARNGGVCEARNQGLAAARGRWVAFVDSDDWIAADRLERMVEAAETLGADWLADDQYVVERPGARPLGRVARREAEGARRVGLEHLIHRDPPERIGYGTLKPLVRRRFLLEQGIEFRVGHERFEDFVFHVECGLAGGVLALLNEPLYFYRRHPGSLTGMDSVATLRGMLRQNALALVLARRHAAQHAIAALARRKVQISRALQYRLIRQALAARAFGSVARQLLFVPGAGLALIVGMGRAATRRLAA